ncbi:hypothetical protein F5B21DRAFT_219438 [Xylaria acuta]|nr:hypothetical protein F5B21DRAFT_219438 [Xylaria acuta]
MFRILLLAFIASAVSQAYALGLYGRQDVDIQTTFLIDGSCGDNKGVILKAHEDARTMVTKILEIEHDELSTLIKYTIPWNSAAATDYFGSPNRNSGYREHILRTLFLSSAAYRGWGLSDWWNDRYVTVTCNDPKGACGSTSPAYTNNDKSQRYPLINYCPTFFANLSSHDTMWAKIQNGAPEMKQNVRNLRSQATTALHELLHINSHWTSNACAGGCIDTPQNIGSDGKERVLTYKAGRSKLLARRNIDAASKTNDNYVYFVMSRWMEKQTNTYPQYPVAWDPSKSREDNENREQDDPGAPTAQDASIWDIEDSATDESINAGAVSDQLYDAEEYPDWYKPLFDALTSGIVDPPVSQPPPSNEPAPRDANPDTIVCESTDGSPLFEDCVHAFSFNDFRSGSVYHGKKDEDHWAAYVMTCAINIRYHEDWTDACTATLGDVLDHATSIFHKCTNGQLGEAGRCGGHVPFTVPDCPGDVQIIHTAVQG